MINGVSQFYNNASPSQLPQVSNPQDLKNEFLKLLMAQLQNQDPTNPVDNSQLLAQQAQFASLEQMQNLNTNMVSLMAMQNVTQATSLIGRTVTGTDINGLPVRGIVTAVKFDNGSPSLTVGSQTLSPSGISQVG